MTLGVVVIQWPADPLEPLEPFDYAAAPNIEGALARIEREYRTWRDNPEIGVRWPSWENVGREVVPYLIDEWDVIGDEERHTGFSGLALPGWVVVLSVPYDGDDADLPAQTIRYVVLPIADPRAGRL